MFKILKRPFSTGAESIYKSLLYNNVKNLFMYPGGAIMPFTKLLNSNQINYFVNNHEQNCGHSATGYAKSSDQTGVVVVTSGPGLTNMITPILDATNDSTPLVVLSGQVPIANMNTLAFQECPAVEITKPCTKWSYCAQKNDNIYELINTAFKIANSGKKGSVHIDLPKCILNSENGVNTNFGLYQDTHNYTKDITNYYDTDYEFLHELIVQSKRPILYVGKGCNENSKELYTFATKYNIYVTTTIHAMGTFNEKHHLSLGFLGMHGFPVANYGIQNADLIIALGSRFDDRTTGNISKYAPLCKNIIHVNIEESELGKVIDTCKNKKVYKLHMDCSTFLLNMNNVYIEHINIKRKTLCSKQVSYPKIDRVEWSKQINEWKNIKIEYNTPDNDKLNTQMVIEQINKSMNHSNTIITSGVGNHQMMCSQFIRWTQPKQFITSGSLGVMGVGLPYAIGAQIANPDKTVIDIDGDASFNHTLGDLQTIARHKLPIKIFIMNDGEMSMVKAWENIFYDKIYVGTECSYNPNYNMLALTYGIHTVTIENKTELQRLVEYAINYEGPIICNVKVESDLCLPLVAPGKALDDMILLNIKNNIKLTGESPS